MSQGLKIVINFKLGGHYGNESYYNPSIDAILL